VGRKGTGLAEARTATVEAPRERGPVEVRPAWDWNQVLTPHGVLLILPVVALLVWAYWYPFLRWEAVWRRSPAWNHGYLIPVMAVLIAHCRLQERAPRRIQPCLWGLALLLVALVLRVWAHTLMYGYPSEATFLPAVAGVVLLFLGWSMAKALWVPVVYLGLMIPWEAKYYDSVALPLQNFSAAATETLLSAFGMSLARRGNVLSPDGSPAVGVAGACSGLHLLFAFVALGVMMAFMYRRANWERALIMVSSVPIAVFCNIIRVILMTVSSHALFREGVALAEGMPGWSRYLPGPVLGLFAGPSAPRPPEWQEFVPAAAWGNFFVGSEVAVRLRNLYDSVMNPESYLHQSFGFLMLGLAFLLMWLELRAIDVFFIEDAGAAGAPAACADGSGVPSAPPATPAS